MASTQRSVIVGGGARNHARRRPPGGAASRWCDLEREAEAAGPACGLRPGLGERPEGRCRARPGAAPRAMGGLGAQVPGLPGRRLAHAGRRRTPKLALLKEGGRRCPTRNGAVELLTHRGPRGQPGPARRASPAAWLCRADAIVEPRQVLPALRAHLAGGSEGPVGTHGCPARGHRDRAERGARSHRHLAPGRPGDPVPGRGAHRRGRPVPGPRRGCGRRVRLQMVQTAPLAERVTTALADGDSLRYYPLRPPGRGQLAAAGRGGRAGPRPAAAGPAGRRRARPSVTRTSTPSRSRSTSTRTPTTTCAPGPRRCRRVHPAGAAPLGRGLQRGDPETPEYPAVAGHALYHRAEVEPGVVLVTGPGGRGMTCSPAIAEETFR